MRDHPEPRELPVAVCGDPSSRHGIILAKNEVAKAFGIQTAESIWQARQKCPDLLLLPSHHKVTISVGVSCNKVFTKLGSDYKKPDATAVITPEDMERMVWPFNRADAQPFGPNSAKNPSDFPP